MVRAKNFWLISAVTVCFSLFSASIFVPVSPEKRESSLVNVVTSTAEETDSLPEGATIEKEDLGFKLVESSGGCESRLKQYVFRMHSETAGVPEDLRVAFCSWGLADSMSGNWPRIVTKNDGTWIDIQAVTVRQRGVQSDPIFFVKYGPNRPTVIELP